MPKKGEPADANEEQRLYLWVRVFGSVLFMLTLVVTILAVLLLPLLSPGYQVPEGIVIIILGTLATSALALVEVQLRLRRNGWVVGTREEEVRDDE